MCFYISPTHPNKKIAKRDIICYKVLDENWHSLYRNFLYEINKLYIHPYALREEVGRRGDKVIKQGYHSYSNKKAADFDYAKWYRIVVKCIIPEGAEYYYNSVYKEYVSNQIKIIEVIK